jgi:hypothetical protein
MSRRADAARDLLAAIVGGLLGSLVMLAWLCPECARSLMP